MLESLVVTYLAGSQGIPAFFAQETYVSSTQLTVTPVPLVGL